MKEKNVHLLDPIVFPNKTKIYDLKFNPVKENQLAYVDMKGRMKIIQINQENNQVEIVKNYQVSSDSVYSMDYSVDGESLLCGSCEGEIVMIQNNKVKLRKKAHEGKNISSVKFINENIYTTGDSSGTIKIFDIRSKKEVFAFKEQTEDITEFEYSESTNLLLATSIDGTLGVYDFRKQGKEKLYALSDCIEDELYCMKIVKNGQKVACGTSEGPVVLFNWDWFGDMKDRILGHPAGVNCLEKYDENFLVTGCEDGGVRFVSVYPKYIHSIISDKMKGKDIKENKGFNDISSLSLSSDRRLLAVCSNINYLKIYYVGDLDIQLREGEAQQEEDSQGEDDDLGEEAGEIDDSEGDSEFDDDEVEESESKNEDGSKEIDNELQEDIQGEKSDHDSDNDSDKDSNSDSSENKKRKSKKTDKSLKLEKKMNSEWLIEKERRKDFFSDI